MPDASIQPGSGARSAQFVIIAGRGEFVGVGVGDTDLLIAVIRVLFVANEREQGIFLTLGDLRFTEAADDIWTGSPTGLTISTLIRPTMSCRRRLANRLQSVKRSSRCIRIPP